MDRDDLKKVRRVELLARLELLDELIRDQARRAEFAGEMGWDATPYEQRSNLLKVSRQQYVEALRQLLGNDAARGEGANALTIEARKYKSQNSTPNVKPAG